MSEDRQAITIVQVSGINPKQQALLEMPFQQSEHGFVQGNVYIRKSAIRRRLWSVDHTYEVGKPEIIFQTENIIAVTLPVTVMGSERYGVGTGVINRLDSSKKPLEDFKLAREISKAIKMAASDALARAALEFGVGAYLKDKPKNVTEEGFARWLQSLQGVPQTTVTAAASEPEAPAEQPQSTGWASDEHLRRISGWWTAKGVQWTDIEDDMKALGVNGPFDRDGMNKAFAEGRIAYQTGLDIFDRKMTATPPATTREKKPAPAEPAQDADDLEAFFAAPVAEVLAQTSAALTSPAKDDPAENGQKTDKPGNGTYITKNGEKPNWQPSQLERMAGVCQMVYLPNKDVPASQADVMFVLGVTDWKDYPKMDDALEAIRSHILTGDFATLITAVTRKNNLTTIQNSIPFAWNVFGFRGQMEAFIKPAGEPGVSQRFMDWARARLEKNGHYIFGQQEPPMPDLVVTLKKDGNAIVIGRMMELADVPF